MSSTSAMPSRDIHETYDFFEYERLRDSVPPADRTKIDVAILDMNHSWTNLGHDSIVHAVLEAAETLQPELNEKKLKVRVLSYDVRRRLMLPDAPNGRFALYIGTGGPGHLDPRLNDGVSEQSQGIAEDPSWEAPLFRLFDDILANERAALIGICHSFGLMCRWANIARPELRTEKSSGMPTNALSDEGLAHPWFSKFALELADRRFRVVDNRLFDLVIDANGGFTPLAHETPQRTDALTMVELARNGEMPRVLGMNHHPEIIDREHLLTVLKEKRAYGEVTEQWYRERSHTLENEMRGEAERESRRTSFFTLLGPLEWHLRRLVEAR